MNFGNELFSNYPRGPKERQLSPSAEKSSKREIILNQNPASNSNDRRQSLRIR